MSVFIIAEVGVNHNGSVDLAKELIRTASECGADAVKFQTFRTDKLVTENARKAEYQSVNDAESSTQAEMLRRLELSLEQFAELSRECAKYDIAFMTTCFDSDSLTDICEVADPDMLKVGSGELTNLPFLVQHARTGKRIIISTGMATMADVEDALAALAFGYFSDRDSPEGYSWLKRHYYSAEMLAGLKNKVTILHCVTDYPAKPEDLNLDAIRQLRGAFKLDVGYSDHSLGIEACCGAVALGASCLEKHITLDKKMKGPDHAASAAPEEFRAFVAAIRGLEKALVPRIKAPTARELETAEIARRYLVASREIAEGELFSEDNLEIKRSSLGISPVRYWDLVGTRADRSYQPGENI